MKKYNIFEIIPTGETYSDAHGRTVEKSRINYRATHTGKNGGEALNSFLRTLPGHERGQVFKSNAFFATDADGRTRYTAQKI